MRRSTQQIIDHADALASALERYEPRSADERDPQAYHALERAVQERAAAERAVVGAVGAMRAAKYSWASIGGVLGTTGQAAQQRYGALSK